MIDAMHHHAFASLAAWMIVTVKLGSGFPGVGKGPFFSYKYPLFFFFFLSLF